MNLYTRARKHINMSRIKELREENIKKQIIAEVKFKQEIIVAELKRIEAEEAKHIDWRSDLEEGMTTADLGMLNLPAEPDTIQTSIPSTTISSADDDGPPDENGLVIRNQSFQVVDATKTDTITLTISGSFITKTVDELELNDKVSIAVHVDGTYVGNYLAGDPTNDLGGTNGLGNGTHTITIPQRFRKAGVRFDAIQLTAFEGESGTVSITGTGLKRVNPMNVFVSLDNPEANSFMRDGLGNENLSLAQKKKKLEQMLGASAEYLNKVFGKGIFTGATEIADYEPQQSFMDIMVGDQQITQQDGKTINDTTRGIEDGKMDGNPISYDNQGNMVVSQPKSEKKQPFKFKGLTNAELKALAAKDGIPYYGTAGNDQTDRQSTSTQQTSAQQKQIQNAISNNSEIANAAEKLGTQGKTFLDYLTGNLPDTIDNDYLGQEYVNSIFKNAKINNQGTISVGDNIVGTGGEATYDPKTDQVTIPFNYDFKTNDQEFSDPSKAGRTNAFQRAVLNAMGPYSADAQPSLPPAAAPIQSLAGIVFGAAIGTSKALGGASHRPGEVTMNADQLKKTNPTLYRQLVKEETIMEKKKLKSPASLLDKIPGYYDGKPAPLGFPIEEPPKMVNGRHPDLVDGKKVSNRYNRLDPISAKSMPKTGNKYIDAKVAKARKKAK